MTAIDDTVLAAGVAGLAGLYRSGVTDPVAVTARYLDRIARDNPALGAMVAVDRAGAMAAAAQSRARWRAGAPLAPLDGVPMAVKANIAVAGLPWTAGIAAYRERVADADAACVAALRAAGAVILGLTNMDEGALGARGDNPFLGRCHNPYAHGLSPGGSSGGSAVAVAAGLCAAALGTDTIGSVRIPAVYCGVFGHKPRQARIDRHAVVPLSPTFDHVGVIARSAEDCATVLGAMPPGPSDQGRGWGGVDTAADGAHRSGLEHPHPTLPHVGEGLQDEGAGAKRLGVLDVDDPGLAGLAPDAVPIRLPFDFARIARLLLIVAEVEAAAVHGDALRARPEGFSAGFARMLQWGSGAGQSRHAAALQEIATAARAVEAALVGYDALLLPATTQPAFAHDTSAPADQADFMTLAIALGWPATAFPIDTSQGLPIGAQVIARDDATCLALAGTLSRPAVRRPPPAMRR